MTRTRIRRHRSSQAPPSPVGGRREPRSVVRTSASQSARRNGTGTPPQPAPSPTISPPGVLEIARPPVRPGDHRATVPPGPSPRSARSSSGRGDREISLHVRPVAPQAAAPGAAITASGDRNRKAAYQCGGPWTGDHRIRCTGPEFAPVPCAPGASRILPASVRIAPRHGLVHDPSMQASESVAEFTLKAVVVGVVLGLVFGAANAYLGLPVGMTVSSSIPNRRDDRRGVPATAYPRHHPRGQPVADGRLRLDLARDRHHLHDPGPVPVGRDPAVHRWWRSRSRRSARTLGDDPAAPGC